jgi:hypothetical protein
MSWTHLTNYLADKLSFQEYKLMSSPQDNLRRFINNQRPDIQQRGNYSKMTFEDIKRVDRYIQCDIFNSRECCLYRGETKKKYATMSFQRKKVSVLRLLYHNYVGDIEKSDVHTHTCDNPGICCNLNHFSMKSKPNAYRSPRQQIRQLPQYEITPFITEDPVDSGDEGDDEHVFTLE